MKLLVLNYTRKPSSLIWVLPGFCTCVCSKLRSPFDGWVDTSVIVPGSTLCRKSSRYFLLVKVSYSCCISYEWQFKATDVLSVECPTSSFTWVSMKCGIYQCCHFAWDKYTYLIISKFQHKQFSADAFSSFIKKMFSPSVLKRNCFLLRY